MINMFKKTKAFTIMELLIVVVIIGLIIAFTVPKYGKAIAKADERNIITNLKILRTALDIYTQDNTAMSTTGMVDLNAINSSLGLSILDTKATYTATYGPLQNNSGQVTHPSGWALAFDDTHSNRRIHCEVGPCPSCPDEPGDCE